MNDSPCACAAPGPCPRYGREMTGRLHQICRGEGVAPDEAARYRALWDVQAAAARGRPPAACPHAGVALRDDGGRAVTRACGTCPAGVRLKVFPCHHPARAPEEVTVADCDACPYAPRPAEGARRLILKNHLSPGDVLAMTAAVHSLHKAHPGKYLTAVDTTCQPLWEHNPDVAALDLARREGWEEAVMHYPLIDQSNQRAVHFLQGYCDFLENSLGVRVPLLTNRPHVYLSRREKSWLPQVEERTGRPTRYWVVNAGAKRDYTTKSWGRASYQRVVDLLRGKIQFVQVGRAEHDHPRLSGVMDLVGQTDDRQLVRLCHHADGGLGGVTFLMHLMAALEKPYVALMGGREPVQWNSYPRQQLLHTVGLLPCCRSGGCWRSRVVPLGDGDEKDKSLCEAPTWGEGAVPRCMASISPEEVAGKILLFCT